MMLIICAEQSHIQPVYIAQVLFTLAISVKDTDTTQRDNRRTNGTPGWVVRRTRRKRNIFKSTVRVERDAAVTTSKIESELTFDCLF
jgi:hypothetical protein